MASVVITIPDALPRVTAALRDQFPEFAAQGDAAAFKSATAKMWREVLATFEGAKAAGIAYPGYQNSYATAANQARTDAAGIG